MSATWDPDQLKLLRIATAVALGHLQVPADDDLIADLVTGLVSDWLGPPTYPWADPVAVIQEHYGAEATENLMAVALSREASLAAAWSAAFVLGQMHCVRARKELFRRSHESKARRLVYYSFQRGYRNDLFGGAPEGSQELAGMSVGHLFHSTRVLDQVLQDGFITPNIGKGFEVVFLTDWLPWTRCVKPDETSFACWGVLCWRADELLAQQKPLNRLPTFRCLSAMFPDESVSPEYLVPDPPMDLGRLRAILVPTEASDAERRWIRRQLPGVSVLRSLSQFEGAAANESHLDETYFYRLFERSLGQYRACRQWQHLKTTRERSDQDQPAANSDAPPKHGTAAVRERTLRRIRQKLFSEWRCRDYEKIKLIDLLGKLRWPGSRQILVGILTGQRKISNPGNWEEIAVCCLLAFGQHGPDADIRLLERLLTDEKNPVRIRVAAALALGQTGHPDAPRMLLAFRRDLPVSGITHFAIDPAEPKGFEENTSSIEPQQFVKRLYEEQRDDWSASSLLLPLLVAPEEIALTVLLDPSSWRRMVRSPLGSRDGGLLITAAVLARILREGEPDLWWLNRENPLELERIGSLFRRLSQTMWTSLDLPGRPQWIERLERIAASTSSGNVIQRFCSMLEALCEPHVLSQTVSAPTTTETHDDTKTAIGMLTKPLRDEWIRQWLEQSKEVSWYFLLAADERKSVISKWLASIRKGALDKRLKGSRPFENAEDLSLLLGVLDARDDCTGVAVVASYALQLRPHGPYLLAHAVVDLLTRPESPPWTIANWVHGVHQAKGPPWPGTFFQGIFDHVGTRFRNRNVRDLLLAALRHTPQPDVREELQSRLRAFLERSCRAGSSLIRYRALEILAASPGPLDRDSLANAVRHLAECQDPAMRRDAARTIARAARRDLAELLVTLARDPHEVPRIEARRALAALGSKEQACLVMAGLADDVSPAERYAAIVACIRLNLFPAIPRLRQIAAKDQELRAAAADALAHLGDAEGLLEMLNSDAFATAVDSLEALFELPDQPRRRRQLYQQLGSRLRTLAGKTHKPATRCAAITFLGSIGSRREIPLLMRCLYDERDAVRIAAARGLARIRPSTVLPYLLDDGNFLLSDTSISRVRLLAELRRGPPQALSAEDCASIHNKLLEILAGPDVSVEEQIEAARALKAEFPFGTLLRAMFEETTN